MVGAVDINISTPRIQYDIKLKRRITIIRGDSGTGKTFLCTLIQQSKIEPTIKVNCRYNVVSFDNFVDYPNSLKRLEGSVFFIDEGSVLLNDENFRKIMLDYDIWFVVVCRGDSYIELPYSVNEVYTINVSGKYRFLKKYYERTSINDKHYTDILTEDSKSSKLFFNSIGLTCESSYGNDNMVRCATDRSYHHKLYFYDSANFGRQFPALLPYAEKGLIDIVDIESFEFMLLNSNLFLNSKYSKYIKNPVDYVDSRFITWEKYYEWLLNEILIRETGRGYNKNQICYCATTKCCYMQSPCDLKSRVLDKISDILINNNLGYLLRSSSSDLKKLTL